MSKTKGRPPCLLWKAEAREGRGRGPFLKAREWHHLHRPVLPSWAALEEGMSVPCQRRRGGHACLLWKPDDEDGASPSPLRRGTLPPLPPSPARQQKKNNDPTERGNEERGALPLVGLCVWGRWVDGVAQINSVKLTILIYLPPPINFTARFPPSGRGTRKRN